jgi:transcription initiation factor IIE alpha subunit
VSILDRIMKKGGGGGIPKNAAFRITEQGKEKLQKFTGDAKSRILTALETEGSCDAGEISQASGLNRGQVERIMPALLRNGYVQYVGAQTSED